MKKCTYSHEIANVVKQFLTEEEWHFSFNENSGVFDFGLIIRGKIKRIKYIVDVKEDELVVYGFSPIGADSEDSEMMARMAEFICRVNYGLKNGCFEMDFNDGEIRFRSYVDCAGLIPSVEVVENSIHCTAAMFERYAPGIVDIIFTDTTAEEAAAKCEGYLRRDARRARGEMSEDIDDIDISEMISSLAEWLGIDEETDGEIQINPFDKKTEGGAV